MIDTYALDPPKKQMKLAEMFKTHADWRWVELCRCQYDPALCHCLYSISQYFD